VTETLEVLIEIAAIIVVFVLGFRAKMPVGVIMIAGALAVGLIGGFGIPLQHLVEGSFYFLELMSWIITGMVFVKAMGATGALDAIARYLMYRFYRYPSLLLCGLAVIVMFPAMITGSTPVAVLTTGVLVAPVLLRMGVPRLETASIIAMCALCGQSAGPVNVLIMIIATSTFMPYEGFAVPLAMTTFPLAFFSSIYLGRKFISAAELEKLVEQDIAEKKFPSGAKMLALFLPLFVLFALMVGPRVFPFQWPDFSMPMNFMVSTLVALFTGVQRADFRRVSLEAGKDSFSVMSLLAGMGVFVHFLSLTGVSGFLAVMTVALPKRLLYLATVLAPPLLGGPIVPFGVAAIIGPPIVLAFSAQNAVITTSGLSLFLSLGCLFPPTALSTLFAAQITGVYN
jgi:TRAP-type C4-dicarboxylate transport system permease large subunit